MRKVRDWWIAGTAVAVLLGVIGVGAVMAQTPSSTPAQNAPAASSTPSTQNQNGTFKSNEDPTHEANESQQQEAAENSGQFHGGWHGGKSNEDPTHEASESTQREAQENAAQSNSAPNAAPSTSP
jgi:cytoskeletal protein RodZ